MVSLTSLCICATMFESMYVNSVHELTPTNPNDLPTPPHILLYIYRYTAEAFPAFSAEELERLTKERPATLHAASQMEGLTPHTLVYLQNYINKRRKTKKKESMGSMGY